MSSAIITSSQNPRVKQAVRLRDARRRQQCGRFLIDGLRELRLALEAGVELEEIFFRREACDHTTWADLEHRLDRSRTKRTEVSPDVFRRLAFGRRTEGVLAVAVTPNQTLDDLRLPPDPLVAVLDGVEKPGNVGAVLRSADGAGVSAVLLADPSTDLYNPNAIRASLGTIFTTSCRAASAEEILAWLRQRQFRILAARPDATRPYTSENYHGPTALALGSEAEGLSSAFNAVDIEPVQLPMHGKADSLNVSAAAAVLFYEALRRRSGEPSNSSYESPENRRE